LTYLRYTRKIKYILTHARQYDNAPKNETETEKPRKAERFAEKPKENIIYLKYTPEKS